MRTRVLDMIWGGVPLIVTLGDDVSRRVEAEAAGVTIPAGDPAALARATVALLADPARRRAMAARARTLAAGPLSWDEQVRPLAAYCDAVVRGTAPRRPAVAPSEAIVRPNDGWARSLADAFRRIGYRAAGLRARAGRTRA
jgi:hypothetical protein